MSCLDKGVEIARSVDGYAEGFVFGMLRTRAACVCACVCVCGWGFDPGSRLYMFVLVYLLACVLACWAVCS